LSNSSDWYDEIAGEISRYRDKFGEKVYKKYKLEYLLRVAKRVNTFSVDCDECQHFREEITKLVKNLGDPASLTKEERKNHSRVINTTTKHLTKHHKLISAGQYVGIGVGLGLVFGAAFGIVFEDVGFGIAVGAGIGLVIGAVIGTSLDAKAKKKGRVI